MNAVKDAPFYVLVILVVYMIGQPALAYLDPSTGSYALQALMAGIFAVIYYFKAALNRLGKVCRAKSPAHRAL